MASILFGSAEGIEFGPPAEKRSTSAFMLAVLAHLLLLGALTWGVNWKRSDQAASFEAELWSAVPQQAAPRAVEQPPPPPPAPTPPAPRPAPEPPKAVPPAPNVDIALEQEKKRKLLQKQNEIEAQKKEERERAELQAKREKEKEQKVKELAQSKAAEDAKKLEAKKQDAKDQQQKKVADAAAEKQRMENIARSIAQSGATGDANATGAAQRSSGPSASYGGKVAAKIKPNVRFIEDITGNPKADVEVRTTPDGTIISQRLVKSSGNKAWDDAVINAIIRTETMPRDADGRVPTPMIITLSPKELL